MTGFSYDLSVELHLIYHGHLLNVTISNTTMARHSEVVKGDGGKQAKEVRSKVVRGWGRGRAAKATDFGF